MITVQDILEIPDLNLNEGEWALGNTLAICGTIFFRVLMGWICDKFGARRGRQLARRC